MDPVPAFRGEDKAVVGDNLIKGVQLVVFDINQMNLRMFPGEIVIERPSIAPFGISL